MQARKNRLLPFVLVAVIAPVVFLTKSCAVTYPNRNPVGEPFPRVTGQSLEEQPVELPTAFAGGPTVLLVGYKQDSQFDIDRWLMGLLQAEVDANLVEIPTLPALVPTMISGWIDDGMRSGIPEEDWGAVVTLYGDAAKPVAELTGTQEGQRARIIVLDGEGQIVAFEDEGYSARKAMIVAALVAELRGTGAASASEPLD